MRPSFASEVLFAALAGALSIAVLLALAPLVGAAGALSGVMVLAAAAGAAWIGQGLRRRCLGFLLVAGGGLLAACLAPSLAVAAVLIALLYGLVRSLLHRRQPALRAVLLEVLLLGGGLAAAAWIFGSGLWGLALAVWLFFLIQGLHGLMSTVPTAVAAAADDRFEQAAARIRILLAQGSQP